MRVLIIGQAKKFMQTMLHANGVKELLEAGRIDGATEVQVFFRIMVPYIQGTIITVWTTIVIFTLKIFDVVWVMTGGQFGTDVIATQFDRQSFIARNAGYGSGCTDD